MHAVFSQSDQCHDQHITDTLLHADILRVMPSKAIELSAFDAYKKFLSHHDERGELKRPGPLLTGLAGAAAGICLLEHDPLQQ